MLAILYAHLPSGYVWVRRANEITLSALRVLLGGTPDHGVWLSFNIHGELGRNDE